MLNKTRFPSYPRKELWYPTSLPHIQPANFTFLTHAYTRMRSEIRGARGFDGFSSSLSHMTVLTGGCVRKDRVGVCDDRPPPWSMTASRLIYTPPRKRNSLWAPSDSQALCATCVYACVLARVCTQITNDLPDENVTALKVTAPSLSALVIGPVGRPQRGSAPRAEYESLPLLSTVGFRPASESKIHILIIFF